MSPVANALASMVIACLGALLAVVLVSALT